MKTKKFTKSIFIFMAVLIACLFAVPALADKEKPEGDGVSLTETAGEEEPAPEVTLPTEETEPGSVKPERKGGKHHRDDDDDDDRDDDEHRGTRRGNRRYFVDFSELPEDPTDEEIVEFFKKYFTEKDPLQTPESKDGEKTGKGCNGDKGCRPFGRHKDGHRCPCDPVDETVTEVPVEEPAGEAAAGPEAEPTGEATAEPDAGAVL